MVNVMGGVLVADMVGLVAVGRGVGERVLLAQAAIKSSSKIR